MTAAPAPPLIDLSALTVEQLVALAEAATAEARRRLAEQREATPKPEPAD